MDEGWYRLGMVVTLALGVWEGALAIAFRAFSDKKPNVMTAVNYLPSPWCYVAGAVVVVAAVAVIVALDAGRKQVLARRNEPSGA
ncbi:hypothetical protein [Streptomyces sp. I05A-00742]|uniref:hypothetical protein n=1 Tax=Streptomyces sp. I05A-00742 TaxID=2732853 RepID=UPI001488170A|nr:hypothetical protein [Streptomyces sp. I05A-00742]